MAEIIPSPSPSVVIATDLKRVRSVIADTTVLSTDYTIEVDASGGNVIVTFPLASTQFNAPQSAGRIFNIKKIDSSANTVTLTPTAPDTFDGLSNIIISAKDVNYTMQADGPNSMYIRL